MVTACEAVYELSMDMSNLCTHTHTHTASSWSGPVSSQGSYHAMYMCVLPNAMQFIRDKDKPLIDEQSCDNIGQPLEVSSMETLRHYPLESVVFFTQIPYAKKTVMSRMFQFLLTDMGLKFTTSDYPALVESESRSQVSFSTSFFKKKSP